jgi:ribonuclease D
MSHIHVEGASDAAGLRADLAGARRFALDCEAAGFHRYSDRLCLVQVTVGERTYVVDPLAFDAADLLRGPIEDPEIQVLMHGADFDLRLLKRDLGIRLKGLIDTQIAASLLGEEALGLQSLLESRLGVKLSKKYQRADWAERPLSEGMLEYAASDTRHLPALVDIITQELGEAGRLEWAQEEWRALEEVADEAPTQDEPEDPVARVKGARKLPTSSVAAIREALAWRDEIARAKDRAPFRVVGDPQLVEAVMTGARRVEDLTAIKGFPRALAREQGDDLLRRLRDVIARPESELRGYPRDGRRGPGRPPPELEELIERLKKARNSKAQEIGLPRGTLLPNAVIEAIAREAPKDDASLRAVEGMRRWKADVVGAELLEVLRKKS